MGRKKKTTRDIKYNIHGDATRITDTVGKSYSFLIPIIIATIFTIIILFIGNSFFGMEYDVILFLIGINRITILLGVGIIVFLFLFLRLRSTGTKS